MSTVDSATNNQNAQAILHLVLQQWQNRCAAFGKLLDTHDDGFFGRAVAPGKNRGIYLTGHLISSTDALLPLFGLGQQLYPELEAPFLTSPDNTAAAYPTINELRACWNAVISSLETSLKKFTPEDWLGRHMNVSPEDFIKEPHRNKLNVLISRTNHISYHLGQLRLLV